MTEEVAKPKKLTALQRWGAYLDSRGEQPKQIAERLNIHQVTVSNWRAMPEYIAEREKFQDEHMDALEPLISRVKAEALDLHRRSIQSADKLLTVLEEALEATVPDTNLPNWVVRLAAARELAKIIAAPSPLVAKLVQAEAEADARSAGLGSQVVKLELSWSDGRPPRDAEQAGEVIDDGDWTDDPEGTGDAEAPAGHAEEEAAPPAALPPASSAGTGDGERTLMMPAPLPATCTCSNPTQWLEVSCPEHGELAAKLLAEMSGSEVVRLDTAADDVHAAGSNPEEEN